MIWPFALLGVLSIAKAITLNNRLFIAFSTIALVSFIGCMYFALNNPTIAFYMTPARAWQFSIGGFAWLLGRYHLPDLKLAHITGFLGLVLIASALLLIDEFSVYPGSLALLPTLGTALLLCFSSRSYFHSRYLSKWGTLRFRPTPAYSCADVCLNRACRLGCSLYQRRLV